MKLLFLIIFSAVVLVVYNIYNRGDSSGREIEFITNRTDLVRGTLGPDGKIDASTAVYPKLAKEFFQKTGVKVKLTAYVDYKSSIRQRMASKDYGDVVINDDFEPATIETFYKPIGTKQEFKNYRFIDVDSIGNEVYGLPDGYSLSGVVYNKKVFASVGFNTFPKTLSQLHDAFKKIKTAGKVPVIINRGDMWPIYFVGDLCNEFAGASWASAVLWKEKNPFSKNQPFGRALHEVATWVHNGWVEPEFLPNYWENSKTDIAEGKAGMMVLASWAYPQIQERTSIIKGAEPDDIGFAPFPKLDTQKHQYIYAQNSKPLLISNRTKNFEAAKAWIEFLIDSNYSEKQGFLPIKRSEHTSNKILDHIVREIDQGKLVMLNPLPLISDYKMPRTNNMLKDMNIFSDLKYIGNPLDKARISMEAYNNYINQLNRQWEKLRKQLEY